jgi:DNA repair ATPase RecN
VIKSGSVWVIADTDGWAHRFYVRKDATQEQLERLDERKRQREEAETLRQARKALKDRRKGLRRRVQAVWRAYVSQLPRSKKYRLALKYRRLSKSLVAGDKAGEPVNSLDVIAEMGEILVELSSYPAKVVQFDTDGIFETAIGEADDQERKHRREVERLVRYERGISALKHVQPDHDVWGPDLDTRLRVAAEVLRGEKAA